MTQKQSLEKLSLTKVQYNAWTLEGMPKLPDAEGISEWIRKNKSQRGLAIDRGPKDKSTISVEDSGDTWESRVIRAKQTERETHKSYLEALSAGESVKLEKLLSCHSRSVQAVGEAEQIAAKVQIDTKQLLRADSVRELMREVARPIREALDNLPLQERSRCNPEHPDIAEMALADWRNRLMNSVSTMETSFDNK